MKKHKIFSIGVITIILMGYTSCKKQLNVQNPNQPTISQASTESGIISLSIGGVYTDGFNGVPLGSLNALGNSYFSMALYYHELLADDINSDIANQNINVVNLPDYAIFDNGSKSVNQSPHKINVRINNSRDKRASNMFYYEWAYMYGLNNAMNTVLSTVPAVSFSGDAATRANTIKAWAYWWKGFAYARIGSIYYAGIINSTSGATNSTYVTHDAIITESNRCFNAALSILTAITNKTDYTTVLSQLIPSVSQTGNGGVPTPAQWIDNINTMLARNILANKLTSAMTATDWANVLTLVNAGITSSDVVFTGATASANAFFGLTSGTTAAMTAGNNASTTFKISERLIQEYKTGDKRMAKNFTTQTYLNTVGGFTASTRWQLVNGGVAAITLPSGANQQSFLLADKITAGNYQVFIAGSYEENELMKAEALINTGQTDLGLASVDKVRAYQGASLAAVSGTGLTLAAAKEELRKERRVALLFRGTAFYDARRWGVIYDVSKGGGRTGCVIVSSTGVLSINGTINYNFLDYWDVPADETVINPPGAGSAPVVNPN